MSRKVAAAAVDFLFNRSGTSAEIAIRFFGGEPLLNFPTLQFVTSYANLKAQREGKEVTFLLSTNGTLLSEAVADFLWQHKVRACISLDGPHNLHDLHRRFRNGRGSFLDVQAGVSRLLARLPSRLQAQAVLTRQSGEKLKEIALFFREMGFSGVQVGFVDSKKKAGYSLTDSFFEGFFRDYVEVVSECMVNASPCRFNLSGHDTVLRRIHKSERSFYGCLTLAGIHMLHVDPRGDLFPCYRLTTQDHCLGNVLRGIDWLHGNRIRRSFVNNHVDANGCRQCWARYLCGGRCPAHFGLRANKDFPAKCHLRQRMSANLRLYARLWHRHRRLLDNLYGGGPNQDFPGGN